MAVIPPDLLECSICSSRYEDPHSLPCLHTFCQKCIAGWLNKKAECPICREPYSVANLKKSFALNEMVNCAQADRSRLCAECKLPAASLMECDHCRKSICSACQKMHTVEVRQEVQRLCDELISVTAPELERHNESIVMLMSKASNAKECLIRELREAHELLVTQIYNLREKSLGMLDKVEMSNPVLNTQIEDVDSLIARIETVSTASAEIIEKGDLKKLVELDKDISQLQNDIEAFHSREKDVNSNPNELSLKNLKINPAYKFIVNVIEETDMLRKIDA